jgi:hypothetical protein
MAGQPGEKSERTALLQKRKWLLTPAGLALVLAAASIVAVLALVAVMLAGQRGASGSATAVFRQISEAELRAMAPEQLAGLKRTEVKVETSDGMNVPATALDASYRVGARRVDLKIVHSPDLDQVVGFGGAATTTYDRPSGDGYQKRWREAGAIFVESLDRQAGAATFGRVGQNFYVMARGKGGVSIEELRAAVAQVGGGALPGPKSGG